MTGMQREPFSDLFFAPLNETLVCKDFFLSDREKNHISDLAMWTRDMKCNYLSLLISLSISIQFFQYLACFSFFLFRRSNEHDYLILHVLMYDFGLHFNGPCIARESNETWVWKKGVGCMASCFTFPCSVAWHMNIIRLRLPSTPSCCLSHWPPYPPLLSTLLPSTTSFLSVLSLNRKAKSEPMIFAMCWFIFMAQSLYHNMAGEGVPKACFGLHLKREENSRWLSIWLKALSSVPWWLFLWIYPIPEIPFIGPLLFDKETWKKGLLSSMMFRFPFMLSPKTRQTEK